MIQRTCWDKEIANYGAKIERKNRHLPTDIPPSAIGFYAFLLCSDYLHLATMRIPLINKFRKLDKHWHAPNPFSNITHPPDNKS